MSDNGDSIRVRLVPMVDADIEALNAARDAMRLLDELRDNDSYGAHRQTLKMISDRALVSGSYDMPLPGEPWDHRQRMVFPEEYAPLPE